MATSQDPLHVALLEPFLPPPLKVEEHARIFQRAYDALSDTYQDDPKVHTAKRIALVDRSTFVILEAIHLKYVPTPDMREKLVSLILKFIAPAEAEESTGGCRMHTKSLSQLLRTGSALLRYRNGKSQMPEGFTIDGEILYKLAQRYLKKNPNVLGFDVTRDDQATCLENIRRLAEFIIIGRTYFTVEFAFKMLEIGKGMIESHAGRITAVAHEGLGLIRLFFSVRTFASPSFLETLMEWMDFPESSTCEDWARLVFSMLKKFTGKRENCRLLTPHLRKLYGVIAKWSDVSPSIPSKYGMARWPLRLYGYQLGLLSTSIGTVAIRTLECGAEDDDLLSDINDIDLVRSSGLPLGAALLFQYMSAMDNSFHPSTKVKSTTPAKMLKVLCKGFAREQGKLRAGGLGGATTVNKIRKHFVQLLLPLACKALYHPMHTFSESALQSLGSLANVDSDAVREKLLPQVFRALDPETSLSHAHQAPQMIRALTYTFWHMALCNAPAIAPHLQSLLSLVLPGIDPNDGIKTMHALNFFALFFASCPLVDCMSSEIDSDTTQGWQEVVRTTAWFEEFASAFLQRLLAYSEKTGKSNGNMDGGINENKGVVANSDSANILHVSLSLSTRFFFSNMSESIKPIIVRDLLDHVMNVREHTIAYHNILKHVGRYAPKLFLPKFLVAVRSKLFVGDKWTRNDDLSSTAAEWYLLAMASACMNAGEICVQHEELFVNVLDIMLKDKRENVRSAAGVLLRSILQNSISSFIVSGNVERKGPISIKDLWCQNGAWSEHKIEWHVPSPAEIDFAKRFCSRFIDESITVLRKHFESPFEKSRTELDQWKYYLDMVVRAVEGITANKEFAQPIRPKIAKFCLEMFRYFGNDETSDPGTLKKGIGLAQLAVSTYGTWDRIGAKLEAYFIDAIAKTVSSLEHSSYWKVILKESEDSESLRWQMETPTFTAILKAEITHVERQMKVFAVEIDPHEKESKELGLLAEALVMNVSQNEYRDVRACTSQSLDDMLSTRRRLCKQCVDVMIDIISKPATSTGTALGTLSMFLKKRVLFSLTTDWQLCKRFYEAAASSVFIDSLVADKKKEAQTILSSLIVAIATKKQNVVPGRDEKSYQEYVLETVARLREKKDEMRWFHTVVATTFMILSEPVGLGAKLEGPRSNACAWYLDLIHREEMPLNQLALSAFLRHQPGGFGGKEDIDAICNSILLDHKDPQSSSAPRSLWTPGVRELFRNLLWSPSNTKGSTYPVRMGMFKLKHSSAVASLCLGQGKHLKHVIDFVSSILRAKDSGVEKKKIVTAAEIFAGAVGGETGPENTTRVIEEFWPVIEDGVSQTPLSWIGMWCHAFTITSVEPGCARVFIKFIHEKIVKEFDVAANRNDGDEETSFAGTTRWLCILSGVLRELPGYTDRTDAQDILRMCLKIMLPSLRRASKSQFDSCRKSASYSLAWLSISAEVHDCVDVREALKVFARTELSCEEAGSAATESACYWMINLASYGLVDYGTPYILELLSATMKFQNASAAGGKHAERVALARTAVSYASSYIQANAGDLDLLIKFVKDSATSSSWHNRIAALSFVVNFYRRHQLVFSSDQKNELMEITQTCLSDKRPEVQDGAREVLTVMMHFCSDLEIEQLSGVFSKMARTKVPKEKFPNKRKKAYRKRLAGVLGLAAIVERFPYSVPHFVPDALVLMCRVAQDPGGASGIIKRALAQFKRTHNDEWSEHMLHFSQSQLDWLQDFFLPNNYYA
eukprot:g8215.t1